MKSLFMHFWSPVCKKERYISNTNYIQKKKKRHGLPRHLKMCIVLTNLHQLDLHLWKIEMIRTFINTLSPSHIPNFPTKYTSRGLGARNESLWNISILHLSIHFQYLSEHSFSLQLHLSSSLQCHIHKQLEATEVLCCQIRRCRWWRVEFCAQSCAWWAAEDCQLCGPVNLCACSRDSGVANDRRTGQSRWRWHCGWCSFLGVTGRDCHVVWAGRWARLIAVMLWWVWAFTHALRPLVGTAWNGKLVWIFTILP